MPHLLTAGLHLDKLLFQVCKLLSLSLQISTQHSHLRHTSENTDMVSETSIQQEDVLLNKANTGEFMACRLDNHHSTLFKQSEEISKAESKAQRI